MATEHIYGDVFMFCCNCGHKIKATDDFCSICGHKKPSNASNINEENLFPTNNLFLFVEKTNGSLYMSNSGVWLYTRWAIYNDKTVIKEIKYDRNFDFLTQKISEFKIIKKTYSLNSKAFKKLNIFTTEILPNTNISPAFDGTNWTIKSYNQYGEKLYSINGHLTDADEFEQIINPHT